MFLVAYYQSTSSLTMNPDARYSVFITSTPANFHSNHAPTRRASTPKRDNRRDSE